MREYIRERSGRGFHGSPLTSETREDASSSASSLCFAVWEKEEEKEEEYDEEEDEENGGRLEKEEIAGARRVVVGVGPHL